jgi:hypothetical protein
VKKKIVWFIISVLLKKVNEIAHNEALYAFFLGPRVSRVIIKLLEKIINQLYICSWNWYLNVVLQIKYLSIF